MTQRLPLSGKVFLVCGLWLVALGLYFALLRPALLPEDPRYIGNSLQAIRAAVPGLEGWLGHVFKRVGRDSDGIRRFSLQAVVSIDKSAWNFATPRWP